MGRKIRTALDTFPVAVNYFDRGLVSDLIRQAGPTGFYVFFRLRCELFSEGLCYRWNQKLKTAFAHRAKVSIEQVNEALECCFELDLFDRTIAENFYYLTSFEIQEEYIEIAKLAKRTAIIIPEGVLLVDPITIDPLKALSAPPRKPDTIINSNLRKIDKSKVKEIGKNPEKSGKIRINPKEKDLNDIAHAFNGNCDQDNGRRQAKNEQKPTTIERSAPLATPSGERIHLEAYRPEFDADRRSALERLPAKGFPDVWLNKTELQSLLTEYQNIGLESQFHHIPFELVQLTLDGWRFDGRDVTRAPVIKWLHSWAKVEAFAQVSKIRRSRGEFTDHFKENVRAWATK